MRGQVRKDTVTIKEMPREFKRLFFFLFFINLVIVAGVAFLAVTL